MAEIDGLYVDPEPPLRERFTLVDCVPAGGLARAMADGRPTMVEESYGTCRALEGLDRDRPEPPPHPLRLLGFRPLTGTIRPRRKTFGRIEVQPGGWLLDLDVTDVQPSALGEGLLDVTVEDGVHGPPPRSTKGIWDMWFTGGPDTLNLWAPFDSTTRRGDQRSRRLLRLERAGDHRLLSGRVGRGGPVHTGLVRLAGGGAPPASRTAELQTVRPRRTAA